MDSRFGDVDWVPDPSAYEGPRPSDLDYDGIQGREPIGSGGFARVSLVTVDGGKYVVKEPVADGTVDGDTIDGFVDEAETWAQLDDHEHVVSVVDWGTRFPWIAMEYMDGGSLADRLEAGQLDTTQALWTGVCLSRALQHAHRHGVAQLDLTPDHVLFRATGDGPWDLPKVGDWGLAEALLDQSETVEGLTPNYAAPEQFDPEEFGQPDDFTDRFQLATVVYEALTGEQAFPGSGPTAMRRVLDGDVTPPTAADPSLPEELDDIFARALSTQKADRYETVVNFRRDLASVLETVLETADEDQGSTGDTSWADEDPESTGDTFGVDESQDTESSTVDPVERQAAASGGLDWDQPATDELVARLRDIETGAQEHVQQISSLFDETTVPATESAPTRLPIRDVYTVSGVGTVLTGEAVTGSLQQGHPVKIRPSDVTGRVDTIEQSHEGINRAVPGQTVSFHVDGVEPDDVRRGDVCGPLDAAPPTAESFRARVIVTDHPSVITAGYTPVIHAHTAQVACTIEKLEAKMNPDDGSVVEENPDFIQSGDAAEVVFEPQKELSVEPIAEIPELGAFTIRDLGQTVGVGGVLEITETTNE